MPAGQSDADRGSTPDAGRYRVLVVTTAVMVTGAFTAFTCITPFLTDVSGIDEAAIGPILLLRGLAGLLGAIAVGFLVCRYAWHTMVVLIAGQTVALIAQYLWSGNPATRSARPPRSPGMVLSGLADRARRPGPRRWRRAAPTSPPPECPPPSTWASPRAR